MDAHAYENGRGGPRFLLQRALRFHCRIQRVARAVERDGKRITHELKDIPVVRINRLMQNFMVAREERRHRFDMMLCQFRAAFNIRKEKGDSARREF